MTRLHVKADESRQWALACQLESIPMDQFELSQHGDLIWCSLFSFLFILHNYCQVMFVLHSIPSFLLFLTTPPPPSPLYVHFISLCPLYSEWVFLALSSSSPSLCVCPSVEAGEISPSSNICCIGSWGRDSSSFQDLAQSFYALPLTFFLPLSFCSR